MFMEPRYETISLWVRRIPLPPCHPPDLSSDLPMEHAGCGDYGMLPLVPHFLMEPMYQLKLS